MSAVTVRDLVPALAVALAGLPLVHAAYAAWVRRRFPRTGEWLEVAGAPLHYTSRGSGPLVVFVHGANGTWQDFPPELLEELARDHTVLAFDRPGHGWSGAGPGPLGLAENAAALAALVRARRARDVTLVGHSYGAAVALRAALEEPELVGHVVAVTPCTVVDPRNGRYADAPLVGGRSGGVCFRFLSLLLVPFGLPLRADAWHPHRPPPGWGPSRAFAYVPSQMHASARNFRELRADLAWLERHLPRLAARLTVLAGAADRVTPPALHVEWLRRAVPAAEVEVMAGVGHWLHRLRPERVAAAVRSGSGARATAGPAR